MKSLERKFDKIQTKNPYWSSYICFAETVKNKKFSLRTITYWFDKLVDKNDYVKSEKKGIIEYLENYSNPPEDGIKQG